MADSPDVEILKDGPLAAAIRAEAEHYALTVPSDDAPMIDEAFVTDDGVIISQAEMQTLLIRQSMRGIDPEKVHREAQNAGLLDVAKSVKGSTQTQSEIRSNDYYAPSATGLKEAKIVEPPYPPELMATFLEVDETHFRCVRTKVTDSVLRMFTLTPVHETEELPFKEETEISKEEKARINDEVRKVRKFILECNDVVGFTGVLERAAMDLESVGWSAIEVIRNVKGEVAQIAHIPAQRVKVLRGFVGFVEQVDAGKYVFYQPFGEKYKDGKWNYVDRKTGDTVGASFGNAANELIWLPKHHPNTVYYGYADVVPACGALLMKTHIRDYGLQFFEHNTIPRYAVIIEGGKVSDSVKTLIQTYFSTNVKGRSHKTLIIPVPSIRGEVKVRFEKLASDQTDGSFIESKRSNNQDIMTSHGVSPAIIGIAEHSELGSGKGLSQAEIYKDRIVTPLQTRWAETINKLFRLGLGVQSIAIKFNPLDIRDNKAEMEIFTKYVATGVMTVNEVRRRIGLDPIEGGDRSFVVVGTMLTYVDEMTEAAGTEMEAMQMELEGAKTKLMIRDAKAAAKPGANGKPPAKPAARA